MKDPVGVEIVDPVQDLIEQGLDHALWHLDLRLLASLYGFVELYDVLGKREGMEGERRGGWGREREGKKRIKREIAERGREGGKGEREEGGERSTTLRIRVFFKDFMKGRLIGGLPAQTEEPSTHTPNKPLSRKNSTTPHTIHYPQLDPFNIPN